MQFSHGRLMTWLCRFNVCNLVRNSDDTMTDCSEIPAALDARRNHVPIGLINFGTVGALAA
jgi:hypothetical protein